MSSINIIILAIGIYLIFRKPINTWLKKKLTRANA